ncbi:glutamate receptor ionotropic, NMDA 1-like [Montipora foliosa]|uniref:glutamate receptor ionotropic, NMDA 1-like n=1 Tax=Montipora foliosa TaxID=591990 RepID=UPI0035F13AFD
MKFRTHREFVKYLPLLFWTCRFFSSAESVKQLININVALFGDRTSYGETLSLPNYYSRTKNLTRISLRVNPIPLNGASFGEISRTFCSKILERNVSVIILQTNREKLACYVAHLASYFQIPVISSGNRAPPLPDKKQFSTYIYNHPSSSTAHFRVLVDLFSFAGKRRAFIIVNDDASYGLALQYFNENSSINIINLGASDNEQQDIVKHLLTIKSSTASVVFLYCRSKLAHIILWLAKDFRLINDDVLWILSEKAVRDIQDTHLLPSLVYLIRQQRRSRQEDFYRRQLIDSLSLLQRTFASLSVEGVHDYLRKPTNCFEAAVWSKGRELYGLLSAAAGMNDMSNHKSSSYEILYLQTPGKEEKVWVQLGRWTSEEGLTFQPSQWSNFEKQSTGDSPILRAAVVEYPPLTMKADFDKTIGCFQGLECKKYIGNTMNFTRHCCYGLAIDVLKHVKTQLQFDPVVYFVRDGNYGAKNATADEWNGVVRDVLDGEADIAIDLMANEARSEVIDFSLRWTYTGLALLVLVGEKEVETLDFSFFEPFTVYLWISIIGVVNVYLGILWFADRVSPFGYHRSFRTGNRDKFDLSGSMWYCWGVCFDNQFVNSRPRSFSARAMAVALAIFALMCVTSYTANLTAHLVSDDTRPYVTGIRDPKLTDPNNEISYGVVKSSYVDSYFELNEDPIMRSMFVRMREKKTFVDNFTDGVERVKNRNLDIFISEVLSLDYEVAKQKSPIYPRLQVIGASSPFAETGYSYAFRKSSPWKPKFDFVINRMKAENKPSELYKKWVSSGDEKSEDYHQMLSARSLSGTFFLGASLAFVSLFFLFLENKLFAKGFIYTDMMGNHVVEKGQRKYSAEVKKKLLDLSKLSKEAAEFPDISGYLHDKRRSTLMLRSFYNPTTVKRKYEEVGESTTATSDV